MKSADTLHASLMAEADRRSKLGHYSVSHDLRRCAGDVARADAMLKSSQTVKAASK